MTSYDERPVQDKVVEHLSSQGYRERSQKDMEKLRQGRMDEVLVEPLLVEGLCKINKDLSEQDALLIIDRVRRTADGEDFVRALAEGYSIKLRPDEPERTIQLIDWRNPDNNVFDVTIEFELRTGAQREPRLDVVCLVNGIPLATVETKGYKHSWHEASRDLALYWSDAPDLEKFSPICVATNGLAFRVAPSGATGASKFAEWRSAWPNGMPENEEDELAIGCLGVLAPNVLPDLAANFVIHETRRGITTTKLARYAQFRATNKVIDRVLEGKHDRGLIWHTQGSGKSLTMILAARKLKLVGLDRPTILIVIDRRDLDKQINGTFAATSFEGVQKALSTKHLNTLLSKDKRGVIVTIVQKFDETITALVERDNVIVMVDEAHRSQEGSFGIRMRAALPNAKIFAFTGTPVETDDRSTRKAFSPVLKTEEGKEVYEAYLDAYGPADAIRDGATVEVRYEPRLQKWQIKGEDLEASFKAAAVDLTEEQLEKLKGDAARFAVVAKAGERVKAIAADAHEFLLSHTNPSGFKAQFVAVDREACVSYAEQFATLLDADEFAVIYSPSPKKDDEAKRRWYATEQLKRLGAPVVADDADESLIPEDEDDVISITEQKAQEKLIERFVDPDDRLKLLIVTDMLLTGFDAPVEQVMFLDKPLRAHRLLQAIMRTNRPFTHPTIGTIKERGIVIDYWGIFEKLEAALAEFSPSDVAMAAQSLDELRDRFPVLLHEALAMVAGMPKQLDTHEEALWLVEHMKKSDNAEKFEERFQAVQSIFESLAPDASLAPHLDDYKRLVEIRAVWRQKARLKDGKDAFDITEFQPKTHKLVQDSIVLMELDTDLPVYVIDGDYLKKLEGLSGDAKATEIEEAIKFEIRQRGGDSDPIARSLAERLEELRKKKEAEASNMLSLLEDFAANIASEKESKEALGLSARASDVFTLLSETIPAAEDAALAEIARELDDLVEAHAKVSGWEERGDVLREIRQEVFLLLAQKPDLQPLLGTPVVDDLVAVMTRQVTKT